MRAKSVLMALSASAMLFSASASATFFENVNVKCLDEVTIKSVHAGYIRSASGGADLGNAIIISWERNNESGQTSFNVFKNLNDSSGQGMFNMAMMALDKGFDVTAWGRDSTCSSGIHQLKITNDRTE